MAFRQVTADTNVQEIVSFQKNRTAVTIKNFSGGTVFISQDKADITSIGFPLAVGDFLTLSLDRGDEPANALYAQMLVGTTDLRLEESYGPREDPSLRVR